MTDFMRSRNMKEDMGEDRQLWRLEVNGRGVYLIFIDTIIAWPSITPYIMPEMTVALTSLLP